MAVDRQAQHTTTSSGQANDRRPVCSKFQSSKGLLLIVCFCFEISQLCLRLRENAEESDNTNPSGTSSPSDDRPAYLGVSHRTLYPRCMHGGLSPDSGPSTPVYMGPKV